MSPEAAVLGLLSAVRATPLAVVYALLTAPSPRRLLTGYTVAGMTVSLVAGIVVVGWFDATAGSSESTTTREVLDLVLGIGALSYAVGFGSGRIGRPAQDRPRRGLPGLEGRLGERLRRPSVPVAALAGALTNLPGLFYVAGLVAILETRPGPVNGVVQVVVYNVLRFAVPVAALALVVLRPEATRGVVDAVRDWARRHSRVLVVGAFGLGGLYLSIKGLVGLVA